MTVWLQEMLAAANLLLIAASLLVLSVWGDALLS
jgi:hypothetical protein